MQPTGNSSLSNLALSKADKIFSEWLSCRGNSELPAQEYSTPCGCTKCTGQKSQLEKNTQPSAARSASASQDRKQHPHPQCASSASTSQITEPELLHSTEKLKQSSLVETISLKPIQSVPKSVENATKPIAFSRIPVRTSTVRITSFPRKIWDEKSRIPRSVSALSVHLVSPPSSARSNIKFDDVDEKRSENTNDKNQILKPFAASQLKTEEQDAPKKGPDASLERDQTIALCSIKIHIRSTNSICQITTVPTVTIGDLISNICQKVRIGASSDRYYLTFREHELNINNTVQESGLIHAADPAYDSLVELRLKYVHQLEESVHLATHIILLSPEVLDYSAILKISLSSPKRQIWSDMLKPLAEQIYNYKSKSSQYGPILIPVPVFTKRAIDELPGVYITVPLNPNEFDWNEFVKAVAVDLEIEWSDIIIVDVKEGSTIFEIKLKAIISCCKEKFSKFAQKLAILILPTSNTAEFIAKHKPSQDIKEVPTIKAKITGFDEGKDFMASETSLIADDIDTLLTFIQRPATISLPIWEYLTEKSRQLATCILPAFQRSSLEFVIENFSLIYNEGWDHLYHQSAVHGEEKILFHGTNRENFDGIFNNNFKFFGTTDEGWYGRGIYFSSSPEYCAFYAKWDRKSILYLICSSVKLGRAYPIKDKAYFGRDMHADYDSHYVKVDKLGHPTDAEHNFFEEFVIKQSEQILPLFIVGLRLVYRFVVWRDPRITNNHNGVVFAKMKEKYGFNIYGSETSAEALSILKCKLEDPKMQCVIVTNGANEGEQFAHQCRTIRTSLPIIVYCMNVDHHKEWAKKVNGNPEIPVTANSTDVFDFISSSFS